MGYKETFRGLKGRQQIVCGSWTKNCTHDPCHSPAHPSLSRVSPVVDGAGCWRVRLGVRTQGGELLAVKKPEGGGV